MVQDESLPEIISFSASASVAKGQHRALTSFHAAEKRKIKERNRRRDERLKAQANMRRRVTATTGKSKHHAENHEVETGDDESGSDLDPRLRWRMTRAMEDAEEEKEESDSANAGADEWGGINVGGGEDVHWQAAGGQDVGMSRGEGTEETEGNSRNADPDSGGGEDDDDGMGALRSQAPSSKYLPDHVFVAAARPKLNPENDVRIPQTTPKTRPTRKRHPLRTRRKDVVVGWVSISHFSILFLFPPFYESDPFPQYTYSSHTVIISGKRACPVAGNDPAACTHRQVLGQCT